MEYVVTLPNRDNNGNGNSNAIRDNDSEKSLITEDESMMSAIVIQQIGRI